MYYVTKRFEFDAAHRLKDYDGPCNRIHGHHYFVEVTIRGNSLDHLGMLLDFGKLKKIVQPMIDAWDHRTILHSEDDVRDCFGDEAFPMEQGNPTAENMALYLFYHIRQGLSDVAADIHSVRVYETPDCWVEFKEE